MTATRAIRIHAHGGPEVLTWESVEIGDPGPGQALVRHTAVGLNFIDVYQRTGLYKLELPATLGLEGAGVVEAVGPGVTELRPGDRVAYCGLPGAYSERAVRLAERLVKLPAGISDDTGAAMMLKGLTAQFLVRRTHKLQAGEAILVHAAAGGVGQILCQWARHLGATVIGVVSTEDKARVAREAGCQHVIVQRGGGFAPEVKRLTGGEGVAVVYDSVGKDTFESSLDSLRPLGLMVCFGNASGPVEPFSPAILAPKGSLFLTRPTLFTYTAKLEDYRRGAAELFEVVEQGAVKIGIGQTYALADTAQAHRDLEARRTTGSTVLKP